MMDEETKLKLSEYGSGYKRKIARLKDDDELPMMEDKIAISTRWCNFLSEMALTQQEDFNLYTFVHHYFLLLCWNLMARSISVSVSDIMYNHIAWEENSLCFKLGKTNGDQERRKSFPRHVYINSANPEICPILAFAKCFQREGSSTLQFGPISQDWPSV
jgi:hypothetical protein